MKTLFLKSDILHIRTNEGEFEVSNPETAGIMQNGKFFLWHTDSNGGYKHTESEGVDCEWPGGVELIESCIKGSCAEANECIQPHYCVAKKLARLIPEESESAYKEVEGKHLNSPYNCPFDNKPCFKSNCVHSDEYPALCGNKDEKMKPVSAPSEYQEDDKFEAFFSEFQERYAFQVPYNGTNEFYNQKKLDQAESFKMDMKFAWDKIFTRKPE